jgi:hypothetical protein
MAQLHFARTPSPHGSYLRLTAVKRSQAEDRDGARDLLALVKKYIAAESFVGLSGRTRNAVLRRLRAEIHAWGHGMHYPNAPRFK